MDIKKITSSKLGKIVVAIVVLIIAFIVAQKVAIQSEKDRIEAQIISTDNWGKGVDSLKSTSDGANWLFNSKLSAGNYAAKWWAIGLTAE